VFISALPDSWEKEQSGQLDPGYSHILVARCRSG
jgi:hypothetical protein